MAAVSDSSLVPEGMELSAPVEVKPKKRLWARMKTPKVKLPAIGEVTWGMLWRATLDFLKDPINVALLVWVLLSVPACVAIMMVKLGIFNRILDVSESRCKHHRIKQERSKSPDKRERPPR